MVKNVPILITPFATISNMLEDWYSFLWDKETKADLWCYIYTG